MIGKRTALTLLTVIAASGPAHAAVTISTAATQNMDCSGGVCAPTASDAVLNVTDLENLLASGSVTIVTTNGSIQANSIDVNAPFSWSAANALTLDAYRSITFSAVVQNGSTGAISLVTNDGGSGGALAFTIGQGRLDFAQTKANLFINGAKYRLEKSLKALAFDIAIKKGGNFALSNNIDAHKDGLYYNSPIPFPFKGSFDGLGHEIANLRVADASNMDDGLFADIESSGLVRSVTLSNVGIGSVAYGGALAGYNDGTIMNCASSGKVSADDGAGGLVGFNNIGTITASQSSATVHAKGNAGGLVGNNYGVVAVSFATGKVAGKVAVGGLVGGNAATIENSYALGEIQGTRGSWIGGFAGYTRGNISTSYSIGAVSSKKKHPNFIGGFDGQNDNGMNANSYWDTETSGQDQGSGDGNDAGLTGLTTQQFQSGLPTGFDPAIWAEDANINNGFPYLINNPPSK